MLSAKLESAISHPYFLPSLIEVSHVAGRGVPLELTGGTKSGAQRARSYGLAASGLLYSTVLSDPAAKSFLQLACHAVVQKLIKCVYIMKETLCKNNLNSIEDVPTICANFIVIIFTVSDTKIQDITFVLPQVYS
jgi:hypothetical protein